MASHIAHKHHRGHGKPPLGLLGPWYQALQFVYRSRGLGRERWTGHILSLLPARGEQAGWAAQAKARSYLEGSS